jgi:hypothetical protein
VDARGLLRFSASSSIPGRIHIHPYRRLFVDIPSRCSSLTTQSQSLVSAQSQSLSWSEYCADDEHHRFPKNFIPLLISDRITPSVFPVIIMSTHLPPGSSSSSSSLKDTVVAYRRLPTLRKILLFTGLSFLALLLIHSSRRGGVRPFHLGRPPHPPHGRPPTLNEQIPPTTSPYERRVWERRKEVVRKAFQHAYAGYERFAFGFDELMPLSNGTRNKCVVVVDCYDII